MSAPESEPQAAPPDTTQREPQRDQSRARLEEALVEIKRVIAGQDEMLERVLVCLVAGGHLLIEGVPGAREDPHDQDDGGGLGGSFKRIQFTPDLVPGDLVGTRIYRPDEGGFETDLGPVFCNFLLADEINRAPAKVQSALLEVMQERQVTIGHDTHLVPEAVPRDGDAEPDRVRGDLSAARGAGRPLHAEDPRRVSRARRGADRGHAVARRPRRRATDPAGLRSSPSCSAPSRAFTSTRCLVSYAVSLATATRDPEGSSVSARSRSCVAYGASPRGPIALVASARALALDPRPRLRDPRRHPCARQGRLPPPARADVPALAVERSADDVLDAVIASVPQPRLERGRPAAE